MKLLAEAAGMSPGNFYLYFDSKSAIIEAMIARDLSEMQRNFDQVRDAGQPRKRFRELIAERFTSAPCGHIPMLQEIEAAALRSPDIAQMLRRFERAVEDDLSALLARLAKADEGANAARFGSHARAIMMLVRGMMSVARLADPAVDRPRNEALSRLLVRLIDQIVDDAIAGPFPERPLP